ncbi:MAG: protein kinase [Gemmataceae bacterium]
MTITPSIPIPPLRRPPATLDQTPPPTIQFGPPQPPNVFGSSRTGSSAFCDDPPLGPSMPEVGESFVGFRLVEELGRGTFGRVFLAHQLDLASRPVALKVTLRPTREPERLARLQHLNVVPVYSVHAVGPMQLICMPLRGRRTLADVVKSHRGSSGGWSKKTRALRGSTTVTTKVRPQKAVPSPAPIPASDLPDDLVGNPVAVLKLLSQLAAGLDHAHGRGILHLDIKPGNVLLADTGEPMLLDFNLSTDATEASRELVGGTVQYMAPEQLLDLRTRGHGGVDARTDLYALGVVAFELLAGEPPFPGSLRALANFDSLMAARQAGPPDLRAANPTVTPAVDAIVRKLLAPDAAQRYQTAADLKEDVDRQLADRPLRFARDKSVAELARKWRRRNPRLLVGGVIAAVVLAAGGSASYAVQAADGRSTAEAHLKAQTTTELLHPLRIDLTTTDDPLTVARGMNRARVLLSDYGLADDPNWRERDTLRRLPHDQRAALLADLGEVALLYASARLTESRAVPGPEGDAIRDDAARFAHAATACFTEAPPALLRLARELGLSAAEPGLPTTPRDEFLSAVEHFRSGRTTDAAAALEDVTFADPTHAAAQYLLATCRDRLGQADAAVERYAVAAALLPRDLRTYRHWGRAELNAKRPDRALKVFDRCVKRLEGVEPGADFRDLRGGARLALGDYPGAADDFTVAIRSGVRPVASLMGRAAARDASGDQAGAAADRRALAAVTPVRAVDWLERGLAIEAHDPTGARRDFETAVAAGAATPDAYRALLRSLLGHTNDAEAALRVAVAAASRFPDCAEFHAARALAFARLGRAAETRDAVAAAAACQPTDLDSFRLAAALARSSDPADRTAALGWLRQAYLAGSRNVSRYESDSDLAALRETPEYFAFRSAAVELEKK